VSETRRCDTPNNCWCVDGAGNKKDGTEHDLLSLDYVCSHDHSYPLGKCHKANAIALLTGGEANTLSCNDNGEYDHEQCDAATETCWCVNNFGEYIENTHKDHANKIDCLILPDCLLQKQTKKLMKQKLKVVVPLCETIPEGVLDTKVCEEYSCWCIDAFGKKIKNTDHTIDENYICNHKVGVRLTQCFQNILDHTFHDHDHHEHSDEKLAECDKDGEHKPEQCDGNVCWCVNAHGEKIKNTKHLKGVDNYCTHKRIYPLKKCSKKTCVCLNYTVKKSKKGKKLLKKGVYSKHSIKDKKSKKCNKWNKIVKLMGKDL